MRKRLTLPTLLSVLALFVALSGTAVAATAVLITRNSQVAAHTIAGANAPRGDKRNLISGTVGSTDLHSGAVTNTKIGTGAVSNTKIGTGSVTPGKLKFPTFNVIEPKTDGVERTLVSTDGVTLTYECFSDFGDPQLTVKIASSAAEPWLTGEVNDLDNNTSTPRNGSIPSGGAQLASAGSDAGTGETIVEFTYQAGTHVALLTVDAAANTLTGNCTVQGAFVPLT
jgi:hypothetical protein